ncbi:MAG: glycoside hydrolase [bacterium]|nr:glycoside hydrolase [bacterium]
MRSKLIVVLICCCLLMFCFKKKRGEHAENYVIKHIEIYSSHDEYCAWPAMIRAANGDILVFFCLTEEHLAPDGKIVLVRSKDNAKTWEKPELVFDSPVDDRDAGVTLLNDGRIITHFWSTHWTCENYLKYPPDAYEKAVIDRWCDYVNQPDYVDAKNWQGTWQLVSADHGKTWSQPMPGKDSVHGGLQLINGTILVAAYRLERDFVGVYAATSLDNSWQQIATVHSPKPDSLRFGEPHILQLASGRILMMIRATAIPYNDADSRCYLWETYSDDNGKTWIETYETPLWGFPPHLVQLSDGRIVCVYGYRRPPFGQRVSISDDGITWNKENEIILRDDAFNKDLGYPVSLELEPGIVLTAYYQPDPKDGEQRMTPPDPKRHRPDILGTIWRVPPKADK